MILPDGWCARACVVHAIDDPARWLETIPEFKTAKRQREWALSRIAEKELRQRGASGPYVSFSHSGDYGAAAVDDSPIGIDVEVVRSISPGAAHLFLTVDEEKAAAECEIENALLHFWSAKEARWKQFGGAVATLKRVPIHVVAVRSDGIDFDVAETVTIDEIVAALSFRA